MFKIANSFQRSYLWIWRGLEKSTTFSVEITLDYLQPYYRSQKYTADLSLSSCVSSNWQSDKGENNCSEAIHMKSGQK